MKTILIRYSFLLGFLAVAPIAFAQEIQFPVAELGNCQSKEACAAYCDVPENGPQCLEFAKKNGLISEAEAKTLEILPQQKGPGGCSTESECRQYCSDPGHSKECIAFAEEHNIGDREELQKAKEFLEKAGPGGCRGVEECGSYCQDPAHQNECIDFAVTNGFLSKEDAARAKKLAGKTGPGGCRGQNECRAYCESPDHLDECLAFAQENSFISPEEAARIKKLGLIAGPGGCKAEQCRTYCEDPAHQIECIDFAEKNNLMTSDEVIRARKFAGKAGPGNCKGPEECRVFCENPANQETCIEHAEREGFLPPEEIARAKKFLKITQEGGPGACKGKDSCESYCHDPEHQDECFEFAKKQGFIRPEDEKNFEVGRKLQQKLKEAGGPGGCKNDEECRVYCQDPAHAEECIAFAATHGGIPEEQARLMLKQFSEQKFGAGEFHPPQDFRHFEQEARQRFEEFRLLEEQFRKSDGGFPAFPGVPGPEGFGPKPGEGGFQNFAGPGGCTSPTECIKFCTEHKEECFSGGGHPPGPGGGFGGEEQECCPAPGEVPFIPQLRGSLIQEFKPGELPEGFHNLAPEERENIFRQKFQGSFPFPGTPPGAFPGRGVQEFPGKAEGGFPPARDEFMKRKLETEQGIFEQERQHQEEFIRRKIEEHPEGFQVPGVIEGQPFNNIAPIPGTPGIFGPFNQQPIEGVHVPEGSIPPPTGTYQQPPSGETYSAPPPPESYTAPSSGTYQQPSSGETYSAPPPSGSYSPPPEYHYPLAPKKGFFANFLYILR